MKLIKPEAHIENQDWTSLLQRLETKGRVCYKSEWRMTDDSAEPFIKFLIQRGHLSVLEHASVSVKFTVDRGVSHEIVRHRIGAYSQESTRFCNYEEDDITLIEPFFFAGGYLKWSAWERACSEAESMYQRLLDSGATAQEARSVLPNSLKTELWATYNLRVWRHFLELRAAKTAHPQMRQVAIPLLLKFKELMPVIFDGIPYDTAFPIKHYAEVIIV
ncbi:thymidylate synthase ThyX [Desulfosporosinus acididurans]|uniref:FAD-dependent thymidylate synthase n=1 Tax=Desulfosporosinus acididurans TaxID=476652 RepID=A0A0J1ILX3_9FIRM|nr:FAD-dependent thymidylate synthase [Desulfosporosinus acididurans]KLU65706.1 thymidylate synthase ThyX [Desulfosporosinus acididurans]